MNWDDYQALGRALRDAHPDMNYLTIANEDLQRLVAALPGFDAVSPVPDMTALTAIRFSWIAAAEGDDDASPYDGSA
jgi:FeS assembly protein IscX